MPIVAVNDMPIVAVNDIRKSYGAAVAVRGVSLDIERGEFITLLGPSGCGKTTLLRIIAGLEAPTAGEVFIEGCDVTRTPPYKRDLGMVFQNLALFPHLTVGQNVAFGLKTRRVDAVKSKRRVEEALELVGLGHVLGRAVHQLSGGQRQRVALARAIAPRPRVLLLDEPLSALDLKLRRQLQIELKQLQRQLGTTFVFVTHDQEEALGMSDRIAVMNAGLVEQLGTAQAVYDRPETLFTARFVGENNLLPARIGADGVAIVAGLGEVRPRRMAADLQQGDDAVVAIRPERMRLADPGDAPVVEGIVTGLVYSGFAMRVSVQTELGELVASLPLGDPDRPVPAVGDTIMLGWEDHAVVVVAGSLGMKAAIA